MTRDIHNTNERNRDIHALHERKRKEREKESFQALSSLLNLKKCSRRNIIDAAINEIISLRNVTCESNINAHDQSLEEDTRENTQERTYIDDSVDYFLSNPLDQYLEAIN